jgi:hypothetical protein
MQARIEIANKLSEALKAYSGEKSRVWQGGDNVRVYFRKGYASITEEGSVDVSTVGGIAFSQGVALRANEAGLKVSGE